MNFEQVIADIKKLKGMGLNSIRPGAEITVLEVDEEQERIVIETAPGEKRSRSFQEIRIIWSELCAKPAVHVDSALKGSGSSRNQPETILANLPYIEWLRYNNKKHIALVGRPTHPLGTLKEMDPVEAEMVKAKLRGTALPVLAEVIVVASDVRQAALALESTTGTSPEPVAPGIYKHERDGVRTLVVASNSAPELEPGTYAVINSTHVSAGSTQVQLGGRVFYAVRSGGLYLMAKVPGAD